MVGSWFVKTDLTWFQRLVLKVLQCGPIPKHVGIIMDGNRRFARQLNLERRYGHLKGFEKLPIVMQWCRDIGIQVLTVYAFSIENFKRSKEEVDTLMELAREKFQLLLDESEDLEKNGVCIRCIGNLALIPPDLRALMAKVVLMTQNYNKFYLNIAFAYTAREEITNAINSVIQGVSENKITDEDIDETLISQCLYTSPTGEPDILVRNSGEVRFSDFLLWQISSTFVVFEKHLWPQYNIWHLFYAIFLYQRANDVIRQVQNEKSLITPILPESEKRKMFLKNLEQQRLIQLHQYAAISANFQ